MEKIVNNKNKYKSNPRQITKKQFDDLKTNLELLGDLSGVVYCINQKSYVGGNQRSEIFNKSKITLLEQYEEPKKDKTVAIGFIEYKGNKYIYREVAFDENEFKRACIVANSNGGSWDYDILANDWDATQLNDWGVEVWNSEEVDSEDPENEEPEKEQEHSTLAERFLMPPFSVLNARSGEWQNRKRQWLSLGIKSELGRGGDDVCRPPMANGKIRENTSRTYKPHIKYEP